MGPGQFLGCRGLHAFFSLAEWGIPRAFSDVLFPLGQPEETIPATELPWALLAGAATGAAPAGAADWGRTRCPPLLPKLWLHLRVPF